MPSPKSRLVEKILQMLDKPDIPDHTKAKLINSAVQLIKPKKKPTTQQHPARLRRRLRHSEEASNNPAKFLDTLKGVNESEPKKTETTEQ